MNTHAQPLNPAFPARTATNGTRPARYPGLTPIEAIQREIGALIRAGFHETPPGWRMAVSILEGMGLGHWTARRMWIEAMQERVTF